MGREVYSSPEAEAIANIDTAVAVLEIVVDELKNTDVANIATEIANLDIWENYDKDVIALVDHPLTTSNRDVMNVSGGAGMLKNMTVYTNQITYITLTLDGVVVMNDSRIKGNDGNDSATVNFDLTYSTSCRLQMRLGSATDINSITIIYGTQ